MWLAPKEIPEVLFLFHAYSFSFVFAIAKTQNKIVCTHTPKIHANVPCDEKRGFLKISLAVATEGLCSEAPVFITAFNPFPRSYTVLHRPTKTPPASPTHTHTDTVPNWSFCLVSSTFHTGLSAASDPYRVLVASRDALVRLARRPVGCEAES